MSAKRIFALAILYTVAMAVAVEFVDVPAGAILIAVANVWFWMGRLSTRLPVAPPTDLPKIRWGRQ